MPTRNLVWLLIVLIVAVVLWQIPSLMARRDEIYTAFGPLLEVRVQILKNYVEPVEDKELLRGAINGMLFRLDPYSTYYDETEYPQFRNRTEGQYYGVGIELGVDPHGVLTIFSPIENAPAYYAGLRADDHIAAINGISTAQMSLPRAVELIQGPAGAEVTLTIRRAGVTDPFDVTVRRSLVKFPTVEGFARTTDHKWDYMVDPEYRIGYVRLLSFDRNTVGQVDLALQALSRQHVTALILDLRDNPGGLLTTAVEVADRFLEKGRIVSWHGRNNPTEVVNANPAPPYPSIPMAVLVNRLSASGSEIVAGALRDHKRAVLIGEKTYGKGSVQRLLPLQHSQGALKLTVAYYYLPEGERIHEKGVKPNIVVPMSDDEREAITEWRRKHKSRYVAPATTKPVEPEVVATSTAPAETSELLDERPPDVQLERALELLRERLISSGTIRTRPADEPASEPALR